ncbi:MAG: hypothetical protein ACP5M9_01820 [Candidatus Micrarchaeia archaeon]
MSFGFNFYNYTIVIYLIAIMLSISGISLGLGYALSEKRLKEFGKNELYESIFNGIIVGSIFLLFSSSGALGVLINQLTLTKNTTISCSSILAQNPAICLANNYLTGTVPYTFDGSQHLSVLSTITGLIIGLVSVNTGLGIIGSTKIDLVIVTISLSSIVNPIISQIQYILRILSTLAISALVQSSLLLFIAFSALTIILPSGIILRAFYPTRKLGGFLMAVAIGLYVVLPLSYVLNASMASSYTSTLNSTSLSEITLSTSSLQNTLLSSRQEAQNSNYTNTNVILNAITGGVTSLVNSITNLLNTIFGIIAYLILYTFILPIFSLILTGISIRELSSILGSEAFFGKFDIL